MSMRHTGTIDISKMTSGETVTVSSTREEFCGEWKLYQCQSHLINGLWVAVDEKGNSLFNICDASGVLADHIDSAITAQSNSDDKRATQEHLIDSVLISYCGETLTPDKVEQIAKEIKGEMKAGAVSWAFK